MSNGLLHHTGRFNNLRQEHFAFAEQIADDIHAIHQRAFDDLNGSAAAGSNLLTNLFGVLNNELRIAMDHRMRKSFFNGLLSPSEVFFTLGA